MVACRFRGEEPQINADERRYSLASDFCKRIHRKVRKEIQQEPLRSLCSPWLNASSAPAHGRAPPAVHLQSSRAGG